MGMRDLSRLERARYLLSQNGFDTATARLACYSDAGFDDHLVHRGGNGRPFGQPLVRGPDETGAGQPPLSRPGHPRRLRAVAGGG